MLTIKEFSKRFDDDVECMKYLRENSVFYKFFECQVCGREMRQVGARMVLRCSGCRKEVSTRIGTFFFGSHLKCSEIMRMGYFWLTAATHEQIMVYTGHAKQTVTDFMRHFRRLVASTLEDVEERIGGENIVVEIDESKLSKRKHNRGHHVEGAWVVGGVEKTEERRLFLVHVENRTRETLERIIRRYVAPGSIVRTDLWKGYGFLDQDLDYTHETVNHSLYFKDPITGVNTNTIEGTWSVLKRSIAMRYRTNKGIDDHLIEFIWRRKQRERLWDGFIEALRDVHYNIIE